MLSENSVSAYYQWVPYMLLVQACLFWVLKSLWKYACVTCVGGDMFHLIQQLADVTAGSSRVKRLQRLKLTNLLDDWFRLKKEGFKVGFFSSSSQMIALNVCYERFWISYIYLPRAHWKCFFGWNRGSSSLVTFQCASKFYQSDKWFEANSIEMKVVDNFCFRLLTFVSTFFLTFMIWSWI